MEALTSAPGVTLPSIALPNTHLTHNVSNTTLSEHSNSRSPNSIDDQCQVPYCGRKASKVTCPSCRYIACVPCVKAWLLSQMRSPRCINCHFDWSLCLSTLLPPAFVEGVYRRHRAIILLEREKALLPVTQDRARALQHVSKITTTLKQLRLQKDKLLRRTKRYTALQTRLKQPGAILQPEDEFIDDSSSDEAKTFRSAQATSATVSVSVDEENGQSKSAWPARQRYIRPCPSTGCRGFLQLSDWRCGTCTLQVCSKCHEILPRDASSTNDSHVCRSEFVASANEVMKDSRPCPKCFSPIRKEDGCDQMFCVYCKSGFDWATGEPIVLSRLHNPHFFAWQEQQRRQAVTLLEEICPATVGPPESTDDRTRRWMSLEPDPALLCHLCCNDEAFATHMSQWVRCLRKLCELQATPEYRHVTDPSDPQTYEDLRVERLNGSLDDRTWMQRVMVRERQHEKRKAISDILAMWCDVGFEHIQQVQVLLRQWVNHVIDGRPVYLGVSECLRTLDSLHQHCQTQLEHVSRRFKCRVPIIILSQGQIHALRVSLPNNAKRKVAGITTAHEKTGLSSVASTLHTSNSASSLSTPNSSTSASQVQSSDKSKGSRYTLSESKQHSSDDDLPDDDGMDDPDDPYSDFWKVAFAADSSSSESEFEMDPYEMVVEFEDEDEWTVTPVTRTARRDCHTPTVSESTIISTLTSSNKHDVLNAPESSTQVLKDPRMRMTSKGVKRRLDVTNLNVQPKRKSPAFASKEQKCRAKKPGYPHSSQTE